MEDKLKKMTDIVETILKEDINARKNDTYLISKVCENMIPNIGRIPFSKAFEDFNLPSFESITRARRKVQEQHPELKDDDVAGKRADAETEFHSFFKKNKQ